MANNDKTVINVTGQPLRYIVTKNSSSIKFLKNSGSMIVYEPLNAYTYSHINLNDDDFDDRYREIWVSSYFLAGGYGAKSRTEQNKLSYIANNYDNDLNVINYKINSYAYDFSTSIKMLDKTKVTRGIDPELTPRESNSDYDISYNAFDFGGENILLSELYEKLTHIQSLSRLEVTNVVYDVKCYNDNNIYHNNDNVPINNQIEYITVTITGNNHDSGGVNTVTVNIYAQDDQNPNEVKYPQPKEQFEITNIQNLITNNQISNSNFVYNFSKNYGGRIIYKIREGENIVIDNISLEINGSQDVQSINKLSGEKRLLQNDIYKLKLNGVKGVKYLFIPNHLDSIDEARYLVTPLLSHPIYSGCSIVKIKVNSQNTNNCLSILINKEYGRLIDCEFVDYTSNNIYNITNLKEIKEFANINGLNYFEYYWNIGQNAQFNNNVNPGFISKINGNLVFNEGELILTFSKQLSNISIMNDTYIGDYWISSTSV